jgi:hypothetical protein
VKPITYKEAASILGTTVGAIKGAVHHKTLTKIPSISHSGLLIEEQVKLFEGKKQIRFTLLSDKERILWQKYKNEVNLTSEREVPKETPFLMKHHSITLWVMTYSNYLKVNIPEHTDSLKHTVVI